MKKNVTDYRVGNKRVIIRCDLNVPIENGEITDDTRIRKSLETIEYLINGRAKVIILSHFGRVKEESDKEKYSLKPVCDRLNKFLYKPAKFIPFTRGVEVENAVNSMEAGDVIMLENTRFEDLDNNKESNNDLELSKYWASLADIYINDAFGTLHRNHASVVGIPSFIPSGIGFLVKNEIEKFEKTLSKPKRPLMVVLGGAKVSDKLGAIRNLVNIADLILIGGGMSFTFYKALGYDIGLSIVDDESLEFCKKLYDVYKNKIYLPEDILVASSISEGASVRNISYKDIRQNEIGVDVGINTISRYKSLLMKAETIIWNGPVGMFEMANFSKGTRKLVEILHSSRANIIVGGGDTVSAVNKFELNNKDVFISTGGGASLRMLEGKELPGIKVISAKNEKTK